MYLDRSICIYLDQSIDLSVYIYLDQSIYLDRYIYIYLDQIYLDI